MKGWLPPVDAALSLAALGLLGGIGIMEVSSGIGPTHWPLWLGLAASIVMLAASIPMKRGVLLGFGAAGVVLFAWEIINEIFGSSIAGPIALLVIGVLFVAMAVLVAVLLPRLGRAEPAASASLSERPPAPPTGATGGVTS